MDRQFSAHLVNTECPEFQATISRRINTMRVAHYPVRFLSILNRLSALLGVLLLLAAALYANRDCFSWKQELGETLFVVNRTDGSGVVGSNGRIVVPFKYDIIREFNQHGLAVIIDQKAGRSGCINRAGEIVIPMNWSSILEFDDQGRAWAFRDNETCLIDTSGQVMEHYPFQFKPPFDALGLARFWRGTLCGLLNKKGECVVEPAWNWVGVFDEAGMASAYRTTAEGEDFYGWIDRSGREVIAFQWEEAVADYDDLSATSTFDTHDMALVRLNKKFGWINRTGDCVIPVEWDHGRRFTDVDDTSLAMVERGGKCGFVNRSGVLVIPLQFDWAGSFDGFGLAPAAVSQEGQLKWGWIGPDGDFAIAPKWNSFRRFAPNGRAVVVRDGLSGCIDRTGRVITPPIWDYISVYSTWDKRPWRNEAIFVIDRTSWQVLDSEGRPILDLGERPSCNGYGFDPAEVGDVEGGFLGFYVRQNSLAKTLYRGSDQLPRFLERPTKRFLEPFAGHSMEYRVLDLKGHEVWSSNQLFRDRTIVLVLVVCGTALLVLRMFRIVAAVRRSRSCIRLAAAVVAGGTGGTSGCTV